LFERALLGKSHEQELLLAALHPGRAGYWALSLFSLSGGHFFNRPAVIGAQAVSG
jgi:hypothetical protein